MPNLGEEPPEDPLLPCEMRPKSEAKGPFPPCKNGYSSDVHPVSHPPIIEPSQPDDLGPKDLARALGIEH